MLISNLMAEKPWNIPLKNEAGKVGWLNRWAIGARDVWVARASEPKENVLIEILHETLPQFGLKKAPKLLIYRDDHPNAASAGRTKSLLFSTSIVDSMSREQLKSIMGHELMHHKKHRQDTAVKTSILVVAAGIEEATGFPVRALV